MPLFTTHHRFRHESVDYVLSTGESDGDVLTLRMCDGTSTWTARLPPEGMTPPKTIARDLFRARLLAGLRGEGADACGALEAAPGAAGAIRLLWSLDFPDEELGLHFRLRQEVELAPDILPGEGLRALLEELVTEVDRLQRDVDDHERESVALREQMRELDRVDARLEAARHDAAGGGRRAVFLDVLNRKKRRIAALHEALERWEDGGDALDDGPLSDVPADDDEEEQGPTPADDEPPAEASVGRNAADRAAAPIPEPEEDSFGSDPLNLL